MNTLTKRVTKLEEGTSAQVQAALDKLVALLVQDAGDVLADDPGAASPQAKAAFAAAFEQLSLSERGVLAWHYENRRLT